jgi:hypothetical protein
VAIVVALFAAFVPTTQARIEYALCPTSRFVPSRFLPFISTACMHPAVRAASVTHPVQRIDLEALITRVIVRSGDFVVVEGANRMGKSTLVQNVSASLSSFRTVRLINCTSTTSGA